MTPRGVIIHPQILIRKIVIADVSVAKNYLSETEMPYLERTVSLYLNYAELQVK